VGRVSGDGPAKRHGTRVFAAVAIVGAVLVAGAVVAMWPTSKPHPEGTLGVAGRSAPQVLLPAPPPASATRGPALSPAPAVSSSATPTPTTAPSSGRPSTAAPAPPPVPVPPPASKRCTKPVFVTSDHNGGWSTGGYFVHNNMWNDSVPLGPETLSACAYNNWYVVSNQTDDAGAVKTYPNVHKDYNEPRISSFGRLSSSFAATAPHTGIYDVAYDIWTNGVATSGSTEIMIWTENFHQVPAGQKVRTVALGGHTYNVWKTSNNSYIAFVPTRVMRSGMVDLLALFKWTMNQGWLASNSTLGQICYGVEIVSTGGTKQTFSFTNFSISSS
jgi:Glycosyl hydrolase family 12